MNISESFQTPHNLQSEQSILGGLLIDGNAIDRIGELVEKDFYSEAHRLIFKAIQKQAADGNQWDAITVAELLEQHKKLEAAGGRSKFCKYQTPCRDSPREFKAQADHGSC